MPFCQKLIIYPSEGRANVVIARKIVQMELMKSDVKRTLVALVLNVKTGTVVRKSPKFVMERQIAKIAQTKR